MNDIFLRDEMYVQRCYNSVSRIDRNEILVSTPTFVRTRNPMMTWKIAIKMAVIETSEYHIF